VTNPCFLLCSMDSLPCDHLCFGESGPDSATRHLPYNSIPIGLPGWRDSTGSFLTTILLLLHTTLCVRSTLFQLYLKPCPVHKQTNKWVCSSSVWWCWFEMNWNFGKLEECSLFESPTASHNSVL
jgi:hypothetical protein